MRESNVADRHVFTPYQSFVLTKLKHMVDVMKSYDFEANHEEWLQSAFKKSIYSTLRDAIESNIGNEAKEMIRRRQYVMR